MRCFNQSGDRQCGRNNGRLVCTVHSVQTHCWWPESCYIRMQYDVQLACEWNMVMPVVVRVVVVPVFNGPQEY